MRDRYVVGALVLGIAVVGLVGVAPVVPAAESPVSTCLRSGPSCLPGRLEVNFSGVGVSPQTLSRGKPIPVGFGVGATISTGGESHPSALREAIVDVDKDAEMDVRGLPACGYRWLATRDVAEARKKCRRAIVGSGDAVASVTLPETTPVAAQSRLTVFNGGRRGRSTILFVHGYTQLPRPEAIVARIAVEKIAGGLHSVIHVPAIADGFGSLTEISLKLRRFFSHRGQRRSFLSARCPDGKFIVQTPKLVFKNEARIPGVAAQTVLKGSLAIPCKPKG